MLETGATGAAPDRYTHGHEKAVLRSHGERTAANSTGYLLHHLEPGMRLLDVGFGPGTITLDLARIVAPGQVVGIENSSAPFETASANATRRGDARTEFVHGDVMDLPFEDGSFDVVHTHQVLHHLPDPVGALRQMARVARPGGLVAVREADYAAMSWYPVAPELERWRSLYRAISRGNGAEPDAGRHLRAWANAAGLTDVTITSSNWSYTTAAACQRWGRSQAERVSGAAFTSQAAAHGATASEVALIAQAWRDWGEHPDALFFIPNTELLARV